MCIIFVKEYLSFKSFTQILRVSKIKKKQDVNEFFFKQNSTCPKGNYPIAAFDAAVKNLRVNVLK